GIVNTYYPGSGTPAAGATTITLGAATGASTAIAPGDLLLVIQMQDAQINSANGNNYGDGTGGLTGAGYTAANQTGLYEYVRAASSVSTAGGTLTLISTGTGGGLLNSYANSAATGTRGQRKFQVVRVPQYTSATMGSTLTALAWNGSTGGILALDVAGSLNLNSATVSVSGLGFRGAAGRRLTGGTGGGNDFAVASTNNFHAVKGEGIAGTPRYVYNSATDTVVDNGAEGYPGGDHAKGAPGNAGGGGTDGDPTANDQNSGGGGGGNGGAGGAGGNTWDSKLGRGGVGGVAFAQTANTRLVLGGGGGAGTRNNDNTTPGASGAAGGGMVFIRAGALSGTGTISANGAAAYNETVQDGAGGGGAGGSVFVWVLGSGLANLSINAQGGRGGDAWHNQAPGGTPGERHGPGGGGGGGVIRTSAAIAAGSVTGGANGVTTTALDNYGATAGSNGVTATTLTSSTIPGAKSGAECGQTTDVTMDAFEAVGYDGGVLLEWSTGFEVDNLGFNIYREQNGVRTLVNRSLLAG